MKYQSQENSNGKKFSVVTTCTRNAANFTTLLGRPRTSRCNPGHVKGKPRKAGESVEVVSMGWISFTVRPAGLELTAYSSWWNENSGTAEGSVNQTKTVPCHGEYLAFSLFY